MEIQVQQTDNDQVRRFVADVTISVRENTYVDSTQALISPVASKIFGFPWTEQVIVGSNFVEITKQDWVEWSILEEPLKGLMEEHFNEQSGTIEENPEAATAKTTTLDTPEAKQIAQLIEEQINPALASHGGFVTLHSVENNQVFLEMGGGCQGCAMSMQTMKEGIETSIKELVPSIQGVVDVTNHTMGDNPFYTE